MGFNSAFKGLIGFMGSTWNILFPFEEGNYSANERNLLVGQYAGFAALM